MFSKAAEFEQEYFTRAKEHAWERVEGTLPSRLSDRALDIITHNLTKPLVMIGGRHKFLEGMIAINEAGNLQQRAVAVGCVPLAILFGSASFDQETDVLRVTKTERDYNVKDLLQKAKRVSDYIEARRLIGCVFTGNDLIKFDSPIEISNVSEESTDPKSLPVAQESSAPKRIGSDNKIIPIGNQDLATPEQKVEYIRLVQQSKLQFYGYASLVNEAGSRYTLVLLPYNDHTHSTLPTEGQQSMLDVYNLRKYQLKRPENIADYCLRNFPWSLPRWDNYPESDPQQLVGGLMYSNQLVYLTDVSNFDFSTLCAVISSAVS